VKSFDVAIIGAGPAGLSTALFLTRKGYSVVVLEKRVFPRHKLCGDFLSPVNWPLFHRLGIAEEILFTDHEKIRAFRISAHGGAEASSTFPSRDGRITFGLGIRRDSFDQILLGRAEKTGAVIRQGVRVREIGHDRGRWSVTFDQDATGEQLCATILVGADGRNSWTAQRLGLQPRGKSAAAVVAFQLHLTGVRGIEGEVQVHLFSGGYAGLIGLGNGIANLCFAVERNQVKKCHSIESLLEESLYKNERLRDALVKAERVGEVHSTYPVFFSPRCSYSAGFLLAGDAARVTEPVTGEGVYFALKGGELAAQTIHRAFTRGDFSAVGLSVYERACKKAFFVRAGVNRMIRALIYRPALARPLIELSSRTSLPVVPLVRLLCRGSWEKRVGEGETRAV